MVNVGSGVTMLTNGTRHIDVYTRARNFGNYLLMAVYVNVILHDELRLHQWEYSSDCH